MGAAVAGRTRSAPVTYAVRRAFPCSGCLHYRDRRHSRLHSKRAERMTEKSPITPIAIRVQTKKKCPLEWPMRLVTPTPFPFMWTTGTTNEKSDPRNMMIYPDRRSASTSAPHSQTDGDEHPAHQV